VISSRPWKVVVCPRRIILPPAHYDVHPKAIQEILGHANITTTLNIYGHLLPKVLHSATDRLGALAPDEATDETQ
jgi:hypothetical protein